MKINFILYSGLTASHHLEEIVSMKISTSTESFWTQFQQLHFSGLLLA